MLVYAYRANAATTDLPTVATVNHRGRDIRIANAPDGVWQFLLTEGWLVYPHELPEQDAAPVRAFLETITPPAEEPTEAIVILDEAHSYSIAGTPLPHDFPNRLTWVRAGLETVEAFDALTREDALALKGVGETRYEDAILYLMRSVDDGA